MIMLHDKRKKISHLTTIIIMRNSTLTYRKKKLYCNISVFLIKYFLNKSVFFRNNVFFLLQISKILKFFRIKYTHIIKFLLPKYL